MSNVRVRFAPSPTGFLHVGGARTALFNWLHARHTGGTFVLRIEDTDAAAHVEAAMQLYAEGKAYFCDLTPDQVQERAKASGKPGYDGYSRDRGLEPGPGRVLRFRVPEGETIVRDLVRGEVRFDNSTIEDFVLLRGNGSPMFLLANVVDDRIMAITHVVRAEEHLPNTPKQQMLWQALGSPPPTWAHVPVLVNEQRKKLSKRRDKVAVEQYREDGILAEAMINYLMTLGWAPRGDTEIVPWERIVEEFRLEDVNHSPAFFDIQKLLAFNGEYIRKMSVDAFIEACQPVLTGASASWPAEAFDRAKFGAMAELVQTRVQVLAEVPAMVDFLFLEAPVIDEAAWAKATKDDWAREVVADTASAYGSITEWRAENLKAALEAITESRSLKLGKTQAPIRVAITGRAVGPPLFESLEVLGRDSTLQRLNEALKRLG